MIGALMLMSLLIILLIFRQKYRNSKIRQDIIQNRLLTSEYKTKLSEIESAEESSAAQIDEMKNKIQSLESKILTALKNGKQCYELVNNNGNTIKWSTKDFRDFIEYYKLINISYVV